MRNTYLKTHLYLEDVKNSLLILNEKTANKPTTKTQAGSVTRPVPREDTWVANKHVERCHRRWPLGDCRRKPQMRYSFKTGRTGF